SVFEGGSWGCLFLPFRPKSKLNRIDLNQPTFPFHAKTPTTPRPVLWMFHQPSDHGIRVHVIQFLFFFSPFIDIEIVKPLLPERLQFQPILIKLEFSLPANPLCSFSHLSRNSLLQHLHHCRQCPFLRLA